MTIDAILGLLQSRHNSVLLQLLFLRTGRTRLAIVICTSVNEQNDMGRISGGGGREVGGGQWLRNIKTAVNVRAGTNACNTNNCSNGYVVYRSSLTDKARRAGTRDGIDTVAAV